MKGSGVEWAVEEVERVVEWIAVEVECGVVCKCCVA